MKQRTKEQFSVIIAASSARAFLGGRVSPLPVFIGERKENAIARICCYEPSEFSRPS